MQLTNMALFHQISEPQLSILLDCCDTRTKAYPRGAFVWLAGDPAVDVGIMISGQANIIKEDVLGSRNIISKINPGEIFGETIACAGIATYPVSVEVVSPAEIMLLSLSRVLIQCPKTCDFHAQLIKNLVAIIANKNIILNQKISYLNRKTTRQKVAYMLVDRMTTDHDKTVMLPFSREEMADYLGINRSALSRELSMMADEGLIAFQKNNFSLLDIEKLGELAE